MNSQSITTRMRHLAGLSSEPFDSWRLEEHKTAQVHEATFSPARQASIDASTVASHAKKIEKALNLLSDEQWGGHLDSRELAILEKDTGELLDCQELLEGVMLRAQAMVLNARKRRKAASAAVRKAR